MAKANHTDTFLCGFLSPLPISKDNVTEQTKKPQHFLHKSGTFVNGNTATATGTFCNFCSGDEDNNRARQVGEGEVRKDQLH